MTALVARHLQRSFRSRKGVFRSTSVTTARLTIPTTTYLPKPFNCDFQFWIGIIKHSAL